MLQRVQTVYLLFAGALLALFVALGHVWAPSVGQTAAWLGPLTYVLAGAAAVVALGSTALYKNRATQRRAIGTAQWVCLAMLVPLLIGLFASSQAVGDASTGDPLGLYGRYLVALAPLVAFVFLRMARRGIDRDIATIRSMDRLR